MSWFKNPWEVNNPWAQGKPEFQKAIGTAGYNDDLKPTSNPRDGAIITEKGDFKQIDGTQNYYFET